MEIGLTMLTLPNLSHAVHVERESNLACDEKFRSLSFSAGSLLISRWFLDKVV